MGLFHTGEHLIAQPFFSILKTVYRLISSEKKNTFSVVFFHIHKIFYRFLGSNVDRIQCVKPQVSMKCGSRVYVSSQKIHSTVFADYVLIRAGLQLGMLTIYSKQTYRMVMIGLIVLRIHNIVH